MERVIIHGFTAQAKVQTPKNIETKDWLPLGIHFLPILRYLLVVGVVNFLAPTPISRT